MLAQKLEDLRVRKDRLVDAFVHRQVIHQATYTEQVGKVSEEIALAEIAAHEAKLEEIDVEGVLAFASTYCSTRRDSGWSSRSTRNSGSSR